MTIDQSSRDGPRGMVGIAGMMQGTAISRRDREFYQHAETENINILIICMNSAPHTHTPHTTYTPNQELHTQPHLPRFYDNDKLIYCILSFQQFITLANTTVNCLKTVY